MQLVATDTNGNTQTNLALVVVTGEYKPGRITATVTDLVVPAKGLAISIQRRYDSLERGTSEDFGYGWSVGVNVDLTVDPMNDVTFTLGGRRRTFYFTPQPLFQQFAGLTTPAYTAEPGLPGTLQPSGAGCVLGSGALSFSWDVLMQYGLQWMCDWGAPYSPPGYIYTDAVGTQYAMGADGSLQSITDLSGNSLTVTAAGITSSPSGVSVPFVRDGQGRITQITDTLGRNYLYGYDANGNLATVTFPGIATPAQYQYDPTHLVTAEIDRRGNSNTSTYYADGRLQSITDAAGNTTQWAYDTTARTTTVTNADGGTIMTMADAYGYPLSVTDPLSRTTTYTYDANHDMLTRTDPLGNTWTYTYDPNGNPTSSSDPLGDTSTTQYNQYSGPVAQTDPLGNVKTTAYDALFRPVSMTDSLGQIGSAVYDVTGLITSATDANGNASQLTYNAWGNVIGAIDALGYTASATYDAMGEKLTETDARGNTTRFTYDDAGRLIQTTLADGSSTGKQYDDQGNVTARVDALGRRTTYVYDAMDRVIQTNQPDGTTTSTTYNWRGQPLTATDQEGRVTTYSYDLAGQLLAVTAADISTTQSAYDATGRRISSTDQLGHVTTYTYDNVGRMVKTTNALSQGTTQAYDADGRSISTTDALGRTTQFAYDARSRLTTTTYPDGTTTSPTYDAAGRAITSTDQAGQVTHYSFDNIGRLLSVTDALNHVTQSAYDANGNVLTRTDANGHASAFTYDVLNRLASRTLPAGGNAETFAYNPTGTTAGVTDFNGKTTTFAYDSMDRLLARTPDASFGEPATTFTYTPTGRRATMTDASGTTGYTYDSLDRLLTRVTPIGTLTYTYDVAGNRLSMASSNANGASATYAYDELNRLKMVTATGKTATYTYDVVGNLSQIALPNGVLVTPSRDVMDRVTTLPVTSTPPASYGYTYGPVGNRLTADTTSFNYDSVYGLTKETKPSGALSYLLDAVGNRQSLTSTLAALSPQSFSYDPNDRIVGATYDANGNTLVSASRTFQYDSLNRLTSFNAGTVTMQYDGDGNRVAKGATRYLVDDNGPTGLPQVVEEIAAGAVQKTYVYGPDRISQTIVRGATSYYGYDAHGDVRLLMDGTGAVTDTYDYDAWGNLIASTGTTPNFYLYQGEQYDAESKLYYLRARYYDPLSGRFLTVDPLADEGQRPYLYASADPVNGHDPTGEQDLIEYTLLLMFPRPLTWPHGRWHKCGIEFLIGDDAGAGGGGSGAHEAKDDLNVVQVCSTAEGQTGNPAPGNPPPTGPPGNPSPSAPPPNGCPTPKGQCYCDKRVLGAIERTWIKVSSANGGFKADAGIQHEGGFPTLAVQDGYQPGDIVVGGANGQLTIPTPKCTVATFHTHMSGNGMPSTPGGGNVTGSGDKGDTLSAVNSGKDGYVISAHGLAVAPSSGAAPYFVIEGKNIGDWLKSLRKRCASTP